MVKTLQKKYSPERSCVICKKKYPKKALNRYVLDVFNTITKDINQNLPGRGWYCCNDKACLEKFIKWRPHKRFAKGTGI